MAAIISGFGTNTPVRSVREKWKILEKGNFGHEHEVDYVFISHGHNDHAGDYIHDDFRHELALYVDGLLFTGCAHSGLKNILAACPWLVHTVVGGFHLLDGQELTEQRELSSSLEWPSRDGSRRSQ